MIDPLAGLDVVRKNINLPPIEKWNPPYCGEIDIKICRDGTWLYLGTPIGRPELVRLFASILWREEEEYYLVTPVEKVKNTVEDAPLHVIDFDAIGDSLHFTTKTNDLFIAGSDHPIKITHDKDGAPKPYVLVRRNLWALIDRKCFYRLVDIGEVEGQDFGVRSSGVFFPMIKASELKL